MAGKHHCKTRDTRAKQPHQQSHNIHAYKDPYIVSIRLVVFFFFFFLLSKTKYPNRHSCLCQRDDDFQITWSEGRGILRLWSLTRDDVKKSLKSSTAALEALRFSPFISRG